SRGAGGGCGDADDANVEGEGRVAVLPRTDYVIVRRVDGQDGIAITGSIRRQVRRDAPPAEVTTALDLIAVFEAGVVRPCDVDGLTVDRRGREIRRRRRNGGAVGVGRLGVAVCVEGDHAVAHALLGCGPVVRTSGIRGSGRERRPRPGLARGALDAEAAL